MLRLGQDDGMMEFVEMKRAYFVLISNSGRIIVNEKGLRI